MGDNMRVSFYALVIILATGLFQPALAQDEGFAKGYTPQGSHNSTFKDKAATPPQVMPDVSGAEQDLPPVFQPGLPNAPVTTPPALPQAPQATTYNPQAQGMVDAGSLQQDPCADFSADYDLYTVCRDRTQKLERAQALREQQMKKLQEKKDKRAADKAPKTATPATAGESAAAGNAVPAQTAPAAAQ